MVLGYTLLLIGFALNGLILITYINIIKRQEALLKEAIRQFNHIAVARGNR